TLAREKAAEQLSTHFDELSAKMRRYATDYDVYMTEKNTNATAQAPAPLDLKALAEGMDVEAFEIQSATPQQVANQDIGKAFRSQQTASGGPGRTIPFVEFAFADNLPELKSDIVQDAENNFYLFWK